MKSPFFICTAVALLAATTAAYSNHFHNGFHFDDFHTIVNNSYIQNLRNIPLFFTDGTTFSSLPTNQTYRPIVSTTLAVDWAAAAGTASGTFCFHLSTFLLFLLQGLLMFMLFRKVFRLSGDHQLAVPAALLGVALYILHPANAETVNYVIARSDSLSTLFVVLALVLFTCSSFCRSHHVYLAPLAAGALAKPVAVIFVPILFLYLLLFEGKDVPGEDLPTDKRRVLVSAIGKTVPSLLFGAALLIFIQRMQPATWSPGGPALYNYLITQPFVVLHYFGTFFLPVGLSADTDLRPFRTILDIRALAGICFLVILVVAACLLSTKTKLRPISFGLLWFLVTLLPTSLFPLAEVMNDHRTFLPYVGLTLAAGWALTLFVQGLLERHPEPVWRSSTAAILAALLFLAGWGTYRRNAVWRSEESLWRDVTVKSPGNGRGQMNYGLALMAKGDFAGAEISFRKALALAPKYAPIHVNMAIVKGTTGKDREAETWFRSAISCNPRSPDGYFFYARFLRNRHRYEEAIGVLRKTLALSPGHLEAGHLLTELYREERRGPKPAEVTLQAPARQEERP